MRLSMLGDPTAAQPRRRGPGTERLHGLRIREGFYQKYLGGKAVLDIGYKGGVPDASTVVEHAIGIELDYPGYDGTHLPFPDRSQDAVFVSHCLEHIANYRDVLADWYRVLKIGGFLIIVVPHRHLYERKPTLPSRFNPDHKRFYTSGSLLAEVERALPVSSFRIRSLREIDEGFDYSLSPFQHAAGSYDIELVIEKIAIPEWVGALSLNDAAKASMRYYVRLLRELLAMPPEAAMHIAAERAAANDIAALPPFPALVEEMQASPQECTVIRNLLKPLIARSPFDRDFYLSTHPDLRAAVAAERLLDPHQHFLDHGYFEGRIAAPTDIWR